MSIAVHYNHFDILEYVKMAKENGISEQFAEYSARQIEKLSETIQEQKVEISALKLKEPATKGDMYVVKEEIKKLEVKIEQYRYDSLKFVVYTGIGVVISLGGFIFTMFKLLAKGML